MFYINSPILDFVSDVMMPDIDMFGPLVEPLTFSNVNGRGIVLEDPGGVSITES